MKKTMITLLAAAMVAVAAPAFATEHIHGDSGMAMNEQQAKECDMLLKSCIKEVDSIQEHIKKLQSAINEKGSNAYTQEELRILSDKLKDANENLRELTKPGR
jgi:peptidoglycan hydrolase CwlO-like protein